MEKIKQFLMLPFSHLEKSHSGAPDYQTVKQKKCSKKAGLNKRIFLLNYCQFTLCNNDKATSKTNKFCTFLKTDPKIYLCVLSPLFQLCQISGQGLSLIM